MNKRRLIPAALWVTAISPLFFASCVDDSYDLSKDIDMTVTVGGNLGIPGGGTEEFTLEDIMDLDDPDNSVLQADPVTGEYKLLKSSSEETSVHIDAVTITGESDQSHQTLTFNTPIGETLTSDVNDLQIHFDFENDDITDDIVTLSEADVNCDAIMILDYSETTTGDVGALTLKKGFEIEIAVQGQKEQQGKDNTLVINITDKGNAREQFEVVESDATLGNQTIRFKKDEVIQRGDKLEIPITISRIQNIPTNQGLTSVGHFVINTTISAKGTASIPAGGNSDVTINLNIGAEPATVTLESATGKVNPNIDIDIDPVTIDDVPDFLNEDNNTLDIKNPCIMLSVTNDAPVDVNIKADIIRSKDGNQDYTLQIGVPEEDASKPENADKRIILAKGSKDNPVTTTYYLSRVAMPGVDNNIELGEDIYNLIKTIPDEIRLENVEAKALQNEEYTITLGETGADYLVNTTYELNAPLQFGPDLVINYNDTINDWQSDLEDISFKNAVVEMTALNGIPLNFGIEATAIDVNGNAIPNVKAEVVGNIKPGNKIVRKDEYGNDINSTGTATESAITVRLSSENGNIENLDGLRITLSGNTNEAPDVVLNKNMTLQLTNIRIRIEGGVTMDLN